ncbi:glycosyltransferase family 4 protein [Leptothoe spongobia]|uniref:Glycosyltransferase family 4 protein n=1 Tax=Leptothoe spongobia TAU-MAC 1115 TaxID=1967444 RepID=A0A947DGQ6_9CYAN|nr:glycosyltransferase family 1 protein [Leptothoe spongobia]MBT9316762.1 glycosyltransferase family 4 protein [Leptothoe spongobia TAU-MAC 1115]
MLVNLAYLLKKPTGTTTYALNLLPALAELEPYFLATPASGLEHYYPVPNNLTAEFGIRGHMRRLLWTQFQLPGICRTYSRKYQSSDLLFSPITEAPIFTNCRFVVTVHDLTPLRFPGLSKALTWLYKHYVPRILNAAEHIICDSQATANDIVEFYGLSAKKVTPILLAYNNNYFRPLALERQNYFLILGRHAPYKNIGMAIDAFASFLKENKAGQSYELWIAGPADTRYTPDLKSQVEALSLTQQIKFLNYVAYDELPKLLNQALALVFPSLWEGFGLPALEAMACGTPVIASNIASIPEVTSDAAVLIDPYQPDSLTAAMTEVANDARYCQHLRQAGLKRASQFSWSQTGEATVELLKDYL